MEARREGGPREGTVAGLARRLQRTATLTDPFNRELTTKAEKETRIKEKGERCARQDVFCPETGPDVGALWD